MRLRWSRLAQGLDATESKGGFLFRPFLHLLRKKVGDDDERPLFVLGYRVTRTLRLHTKRQADDVLRRLQTYVTFPGETLLVCLDGKNSGFERRFRRVRGARVL